MPKVHFVKKARKDNPVAKRGESYYWWQFAFSRRSFSKTRPRRSQLTRSDFLGQMYDLEDEIQAFEVDGESLDTVEDWISNTVDSLRTLADEQEEKLYNMPDQLQYSETGELLQERAECTNAVADDLENVVIPDIEDLDDEEIEMELEELVGDIAGITYDGN